MKIGINASPAFKKNRTGVEEYTYQLIKNLAMLPESGKHQFFLYTKEFDGRETDFPSNFKIKKLKSPFLWTQGRLSFEILGHKPDVFFSPSHVLPIFHPKNSVVTIHGLEFEKVPKMYPSFHRRYLKAVTKYSVNNSRSIIAVSENTKKDIIEIYGINPEKITVIWHGIDILSLHEINTKKSEDPFILFLGTKEKKKNISGLIKAFEILKDKYKIREKLVIAGGNPDKRFYKEEKIKETLKESKVVEQITELGFVSEEKKWELLSSSTVLVYPSFYEGFGIPVLEAQSAGTAVVTSNVSALPEIAGKGALLVSPGDVDELAKAILKIVKDNDFRKNMISGGLQNLQRFSWKECAKKTLEVLTKN